jgi:hypothetical protein
MVCCEFELERKFNEGQVKLQVVLTLLAVHRAIRLTRKGEPAVQYPVFHVRCVD